MKPEYTQPNKMKKNNEMYLNTMFHYKGNLRGSFQGSVQYCRNVQICRLFGAKPLSKPMRGYCQLDP